MPRPTRKTKPLIYVFNEGESEQAYTEFLKTSFSDYAVVKYPKTTGLFEVARDRFEKDKKYRDSAEVIDEIWFFFDVEKDEKDKWGSLFQIIKKLRKLRKKPETAYLRGLSASALSDNRRFTHSKSVCGNR